MQYAPSQAFSILGDSISTYAGSNPPANRVYYAGGSCFQTGVTSRDDTWWAQVIRHFGGELLANGSYSGSLVEGAPVGKGAKGEGEIGGFPAGCSVERAAQLAPGGRQPDHVVVFFGINDYGWGGARQQAAGQGAARPRGALWENLVTGVAGAAPADAAERFQAAYELMLQRVRAACPQAQVWCCTLLPGRVAGADASTFAYRIRGIHFDRYNDAIRRAAERTGCHVADVRALGREYEAQDGTHPTNKGMKQLASLVIRAMELAGAQPAAGSDAGQSPAVRHMAAEVRTEGYFGAPRSADTCAKDTCQGCDHAEATGNAWKLVCTANE